MKISSFTGAEKEGMKVFKPIQYLIIKGTKSHATNGLAGASARVRLVNSETGQVDELIPYVPLDMLGKLATFGEGYFIDEGKGSPFVIPIMLHPSQAVYLSNDRYLELDIYGLAADCVTEVYGLEGNISDKVFCARINKFYMAVTELQKSFTVGENENVMIRVSDFANENSEIRLQYKNGATVIYTKPEIEAKMRLVNDIQSTSADIISLSGGSGQVVLGESDFCCFDLHGVETVTISQTSQHSVDLYFIDAFAG